MILKFHQLASRGEYIRSRSVPTEASEVMPFELKKKTKIIDVDFWKPIVSHTLALQLQQEEELEEVVEEEKFSAPHSPL